MFEADLSAVPPYDLWQNERVCSVKCFLACFLCLPLDRHSATMAKKDSLCWVVCEQNSLMKGLIEKKKRRKLPSTSDCPLLLSSHSCYLPVTQSIRGEKMEAGEGGGRNLPLAQMGFH